MAFGKDKLASWFVQNFVVSRSQVFDSPGFILFKISGKANAYSRQIVFPESFFNDLENQVDKKLGEEGNKLIYSFGKKFGYRFASVANAPKLNKLATLESKNYVYLLTRFVEGTYSSGIKHVLFPEEKKITFELNNFVICSKSGKGYFLSAGGIAGIWSKITGLVDVEAVHHKCQGRGDLFCEVIAAPKVILEKQFSNVFEEKSLDNLDLDKNYFSINSPVPITNTSKSFKYFLDSNVFSYSKGIIQMGSKRFFIIEASVIYLLELVFSVNPKATEIVKESAFKLGNELSEKADLQYLTDLFSALGLGDLALIKKADSILVNIDYFPWTRFSEGSKHIFIESLLSGMLSNVLKKRVNLKLKSSGFFGKGYSVSFF